MNGNFARIESRRGQQARGQFAQQARLLVNQSNELGLPCRKASHLAQSRRSSANRRERSFIGMSKAVENRGAQLLGTPLGLNAAFVGKGAIPVEGDGDKRSDGVVGQRAGFAANDKAADRHRSQPNHPAPNPTLRIVVRGFKVVDVLRHLLRVHAPESRRVHIVQIGIEDRDRFEIEDFMHQLGQLRARFHVQIHLQGPPREFVEVFHLPAARLGLAGVTRRLATTAGSP